MELYLSQKGSYSSIFLLNDTKNGKVAPCTPGVYSLA